MATWKNAVPGASEQFEAKREALLREAASSFNGSGYHGTSLTEIAKKLGVTKAALYTYVSSKQDLLYYCHDAAMDTAVECLEQARAMKAPGLDKLMALLQRYLAIMLGEHTYVILLEENAMKPEHVRKVVQRRDEFEQGLRDLVEEGIADGSIVPCNSKLAVFMALGALNWGRKWFSARGKWTGAQISLALTQMLGRSLSTRPVESMYPDPALIDAEEFLKAAHLEQGLADGMHRPA